MSMQVYWSSVFILPVSVSNAIEKLIRDFIWGATNLVQRRSKVAWKDVCLPKEEGGLGIRPLRIWNKILMAYHIWSIVSNRDSLWVKWIHTYRLKGRNFWQQKIPWDASISWKRILSIRETFRQFFHCEIGNGNDTFFWNDIWILEAPLCVRMSHRDITNMGFDGSEKVSNFVVDDQVVFPTSLMIMWPELRGKSLFINVRREDKVVWRSINGKKSAFNSSTVWNDVKETRPRVQWRHLVWYSNSIPKHSFILWLAIRGKLLTQDRMQAWQNMGNSSCAFCGSQWDSLNHLFFECLFCQEIRDYFLQMGVEIDKNIAWADLVDVISHKWRGKSLVIIINKIVLSSLVYYIWQERNLRLFQNQHRSSRQVISSIVETVRFKIMGLKIRSSNRIIPTLRLWNIPWDSSPN